MDLISKVELARLLECSPSSITRLVSYGLPVTADGKIDREQALQYIAGQTGHGGGWGKVFGRGKDLGERARELLGGNAAPAPESDAAADPEIFWELLDRIRTTAAVRLPELARRLGLPEFVAHDAANIFDALLGLCDADLGEYEWEPAGTEPPSASAKVRRQADRYYDEKLLPAVDAIFSAAVLAHPERYPWVSLEWARGIQAGARGAKSNRSGTK